MEDTAAGGSMGFTDDAVVCAYLAFLGHNPSRIEIGDSGRVQLYFESMTLDHALAALDSGQAAVDPVRFSTVLRRIIRTHFTKHARRRLKLQLQGDDGGHGDA